MMSYRFARRSFLASIGGAFGLEILLRNMEASAAGTGGPPPRFLMMHFPVGTIRTQFVPTGTTNFTTAKPTETDPMTGMEYGSGAGYILSPFDTPELKPYTIALYGMSMSGLQCPGGGGHEAGTPFATTGASGPGTRSNGGETDDGCAGGPSWDQIFLKNVPNLSKKDGAGTIIGRGFYNSLADGRIDSFETSTRCLSYGYTKVPVASNQGGMIQENQPLRPQLSAVQAYADLFGSFMGGGGGGMPNLEAIRLLKHRRSVLDYSRRELERLGTLAPSSERIKIEQHAAIIRGIEAELTAAINNPMTGGTCSAPMMPSADLKGPSSDRNSDYGDPTSNVDDGPLHERIGNAHAGIIRAAFACDIIRVATFQWSPGTNHVSFKGLDPNARNTIYMHHPLSHRQGQSTFYTGNRPTTNDAYIWDAMVNANRWYFKRTAAIIDSFRTQIDPLDPAGGNLLERTVIPMVTEVGDASHTRSGHAALIFGGTRLGMVGGQFQQVSGHHNRMWVSVAQAYLGANAMTALNAETFYKNQVTPIPGLWVAPT